MMSLKLKRLERNMSLRTMANKLNISVSTLRIWENSPKKITIENAHRLCEVLGCEMGDIKEWQK